jgi:hypothetical protein
MLLRLLPLFLTLTIQCIMRSKRLSTQYREEYNTEHPSSSLDYQTPADFATHKWRILSHPGTNLIFTLL